MLVWVCLMWEALKVCWAVEEAVAFSDSHDFLCLYACVLCVSVQACVGNVWLLCFPLSNGPISTWSRGI